MSKNRFFKKTYHSNYRGKVSVEDAIKHQTYLDDLRKDAVFYGVDHIESSMIPHSMLHKIIQKLKLKQNDSLTLSEKAYLVRQNLNALHSLVEGKISFNQYKKEVVNDRIKHQEHLEAERLRLEKVRELELIQLNKQQEKLAQERKFREQAERERRKKLESDPKYIERQKEKKLIKKYDIYFYDTADKHRSKLINILKLLENNQRLSEQDAIWLNSEGRQFFTDELKIKFHRVEADFYLNEYKTTKLHWHAINASSQLRKAKASKEAERFLENTEISSNKNKKLLSAYFTTLGGVKRDIRKVDTAIECGVKAHENNSQDYRPCTLLGAIYMENHEYTLGHDWYNKARERGAPEKSIYADLKSILLKLDKSKRNEMIASLLKKDPYIYKWLNEIKR
ncbi:MULTISPECIES: hypothetical protein [Acinetobacter]|uniref:hypothetical protein n=4 Tax=Moraxellaceae TaxID=468 RepID=UPI0018AA8D86|nr:MULTISPECIES: hypothetical protein [Acinetobacter]MBJ9954726.1 hypothetical protein [Acinetobacter baumannii]MCU4416928.1 hypothetical protein [Acinetobacter bereziniae]MDM1785855.1 hypothetical protein [Acinetobacter bereziniae]